MIEWRSTNDDDDSNTTSIWLPKTYVIFVNANEDQSVRDTLDK